MDDTGAGVLAALIKDGVLGAPSEVATSETIAVDSGFIIPDLTDCWIARAGVHIVLVQAKTKDLAHEAARRAFTESGEVASKRVDRMSVLRVMCAQVWRVFGPSGVGELTFFLEGHPMFGGSK